MAITFTGTQATLSAIASALATEATAAGQSGLATALNGMASEMTAATPTDTEFFGGVGTAWAAILNTAANTIQAKSNNTQATQQTTIASEITTIDNHLNRMQSVIYDVENQDTFEGSSSSARFAAGPHIRQIGVGWNDSIYDYSNGELARGLMIMSLKDTNKLEVIKAELENPTPLKGT